MIRAILLASATAATFGGRRARSAVIHIEARAPLRTWRSTVVAPRISRVRNVGLPIFEIRPRRSLPPLEWERGVSPSPMPRKRHKPEGIVATLRQVDVLVSQGHPVPTRSVRSGGELLSLARIRRPEEDQVKRMKELEVENARLRRAVADLTLYKLILNEAASGNYFSIRGS